MGERGETIDRVDVLLWPAYAESTDPQGRSYAACTCCREMTLPLSTVLLLSLRSFSPVPLWPLTEYRRPRFSPSFLPLFEARAASTRFHRDDKRTVDRRRPLPQPPGSLSRRRVCIDTRIREICTRETLYKYRDRTGIEKARGDGDLIKREEVQR